MRKADNNMRKHTFIVLALVCCLLFNSTVAKPEKANALVEEVAVLTVIGTAMIASGIIFNNATSYSTFVGDYYNKCSAETKSAWENVKDGVEEFVDSTLGTIKRRAHIPEFLKHDIIEYSQSQGLEVSGDSVSIDDTGAWFGLSFNPYDDFGKLWFNTGPVTSYPLTTNSYFDYFTIRGHSVEFKKSPSKSQSGRYIYGLFIDGVVEGSAVWADLAAGQPIPNRIFKGCFTKVSNGLSNANVSSIEMWLVDANAIRNNSAPYGQGYDWLSFGILTESAYNKLTGLGYSIADEPKTASNSSASASATYNPSGVWASEPTSTVYIPDTLTDDTQSYADYTTAVGSLTSTGVRDNRIPDVDSGETDIEGGLSIGGLWSNLRTKLDEIIIGVHSIPTVIGNLGTGILDGIRTWWDSLTQSAVDTISGTLESARDWITQVVAPEFVSILDGAKSVVSTFPQYFEDLIHHYIPSPLSDVLVLGIFSGVLILLLRMLLGV